MSAEAPRTGAFWQFSLYIYGISAVRQALLRLQDDNGADVTIVLFILWRASCGYQMGVDSITVMDQRIGPWRDLVVRPLRGVRRAMRGLDVTSPAADALHLQLKRDELDAERIMHAELEAFTPHIPAMAGISAATAAQTGLSVYADLLGRRFSAADVAELSAAMLTLAPVSSV